VTGAVQAAAIRRRIRIPLARLGITIARQVPTALHLTGTNAAYLATKARRGGHDLLSRRLDDAAAPHRHADAPGPAPLGAEGR
jgi:hypothetical protein